MYFSLLFRNSIRPTNQKYNCFLFDLRIKMCTKWKIMKTNTSYVISTMLYKKVIFVLFIKNYLIKDVNKYSIGKWNSNKDLVLGNLVHANDMCSDLWNWVIKIVDTYVQLFCHQKLGTNSDQDQIYQFMSNSQFQSKVSTLKTGKSC